MLNLIKDYALKRADLLKLEATEKGIVTASTLTWIILLAIFGIFFLILFNIGIAVLIGSYINSYSYGFLLVAGFYLLILIILLVSGKSIKSMIANKLLQTFNNPTE